MRFSFLIIVLIYFYNALTYNLKINENGGFMKKQIVNIVNFIRACEPRCTIDLIAPVKEQIKLLNKYNLPGTFLIQYDTLLDDEYCDMLQHTTNEKVDIGIWLEIVQPLVEKAGIEWKGMYTWDWHAHCGFSVGYTLEEREKMIDVFMEDFRLRFGNYPKSIGSWVIDAHTLAYVSDKYGMEASCNCKDQWGTDGYTIWGGYYGQAYYPSRKNMFSPAQTESEQINLPVFRMLGSDPIYQYDCGLDLNKGNAEIQGVITLEPVYSGNQGGGGIPFWIDWYFRENFNQKCLAFAYTQAGQENSFGWPAMQKGLTYQFEQIAKLEKEGKITVETLADSGRWFKQSFKNTPATTIVAENDWRHEGHKSIWYNCMNYRLNLYHENDLFWVRDIYLFSEKYEERYFKETCKTDFLVFDNLPFVDGNRFSGNGIRAGLYPFYMDEPVKFDNLEYTEKQDCAVINYMGTQCGNVTVKATPGYISFCVEKDEYFSLRLNYNPESRSLPSINTNKKIINLEYNGYKYSIELTDGICTNDMSVYLKPTDGKITLKFHT